MNEQDDDAGVALNQMIAMDKALDDVGAAWAQAHKEAVYWRLEAEEVAATVEKQKQMLIDLRAEVEEETEGVGVDAEEEAP